MTDYREFFSNVTPTNFGKGRDKLQPWECVCGHQNPAYYQKKCFMCGVERELIEQAKLKIEERQQTSDEASNND